jgi:uncharacterized SAM-dependent methyltransferase
MTKPINIIIDPSQFPEAVRLEFLRSLRERAINHKFHYESYKQVQRWLALHNAYSPTVTDPNCRSIYDTAFESAAAACAGEAVHLIGLGCGGGEKETRFLKLLAARGKKLHYTPTDVSTPMVLVAALAAQPMVGQSLPIVCDLALTSDLPVLINEQSSPDAAPIFTFFGLIPNFEPNLILPRLKELIPARGLLLFSANLAAGDDYRRGVERIQPQYDNALTREWLMTLLLDLGIEESDGELSWQIEADKSANSNDSPAPLRLAAHFTFHRDRTVRLDDERFLFAAGERIRLFFSYRYIPKQISSLLKTHDFSVEQQWIADSEEEAVFLCRKLAGG